MSTNLDWKVVFAEPVFTGWLSIAMHPFAWTTYFTLSLVVAYIFNIQGKMYHKRSALMCMYSCSIALIVSTSSTNRVSTEEIAVYAKGSSLIVQEKPGIYIDWPIYDSVYFYLGSLESMCEESAKPENIFGEGALEGRRCWRESINPDALKQLRDLSSFNSENRPFSSLSNSKKLAREFPDKAVIRIKTTGW